MRFLQIMSENYDRSEERSRAVEKPDEFVEVAGGGEGGRRAVRSGRMWLWGLCRTLTRRLMI